MDVQGGRIPAGPTGGDGGWDEHPGSGAGGTRRATGGIVHQFVTKNQVVCPARTPWVSSPGTGYLQRSAGQSLRFTGSGQLTGRRGLLGRGGRGGPETSQIFPSQSRRPAAKAGLIAARLFLCRPASVPRILRWRMHENIPTVPYQSPPGTLSRADCGFQKQHSCILVCQVTPRTT